MIAAALAGATVLVLLAPPRPPPIAARGARRAALAMVAGVGASIAGAPVLGAVLVVAALAVPVAMHRLVDDRRRAQADRAVPDAVEVAAGALRAGASLRSALAEAAGVVPPPLAGELAAVVASAETGTRLADALDGWSAARPSPSVRLAAAALALASETGGASARTLDGVAATLRDRHAVQREVQVLATQARVSAAVLGAAPIGFTVVAAAIDPRTAGFLLGSNAGQACLAAGLALDALGLAWMQHLTRVVGR
jgi:tight adherence protein B